MTKVLIIDDEEILLVAYEMAFTKAGYTVLTATGAKEGLDILQKQKPDVILLDMLMPEMNGIDFLRIMKEKGISRQRVVALTNIENPELLKATKTLGVNQYLLKVDYTPKQLIEVTDKLIGRHARVTG